MHQVHYSWHPNETNSNFGFHLPWLDRLLGINKDQPRDGYEDMTIGINLFRQPHGNDSIDGDPTFRRTCQQLSYQIT
jgi:sterol desaturase/sphingolipid hydroxylase (fatty acid hydroxylase superfamily)